MKLLPYDSFEVQTALTLEEVVASLQSVCISRKWFQFRLPEHKIFEGKVSRDGFRIMRTIRYRNAFLPIIIGTFRHGPTGTKITVRMRLHPFVIAFLCIWFGYLGVAISAEATRLLTDKLYPLTPTVLILFALLLFVVALVSFGFWSEAKKAKPALIDILQKNILQ